MALLGRNAEPTSHVVERIFVFRGMERVDVSESHAGDIVAVTGPEGVSIGDTIASLENPQALPSIDINEPTVRMTFGVSTSPFMGIEVRTLYLPPTLRSADERAADQRKHAGGNHL